jgi:hypothetical protein
MHSFFNPHNRKARALCLALFFLCWFALGISIYKQYGISWDETIERTTGIVSVNYLGEKLHLSPIINNETLSKFKHHQLETYPDRVFGPLFGIVSVLLERAFHIGEGWNEKAIFQFRHLLTFLVVLAGGFAIFRLSERRFHDWRIGLLTLTFFILSPRFFAESFYNNKDLVFLACFAIATNCMIRLVLQPSWLSALLAGLAAAIVIDIRVTGIILPIMTLTLLGLRAIKSENSWGATARSLAVYLLVICAAVVVMWPWLWSAPLSRFLEALAAFSRWVRSDSALFFMGHFIRSTNLPWEYAPVWIAITTPLLYLATFLIGALSTISSVVNNRFALWKTPEQLQDLVFLGICCCPILAVIFLHSVIYDGWRHLYFIYPAMLLLATKGWLLIWQQVRHHRIFRIGTLLALIATLLSTTTWMVRAHPLQNVYFNTLVGSDWKSKFDVDYWGLANHIALEYIAQQDDRPLIKVFAGSDMDLNIASVILDPTVRTRIVVVNAIGNADYILSNYRANSTDYASGNMPFDLIYQITVGDEVIESIYRRKKDFGPVPTTQLNEVMDFSKPQVSKLFLIGVGAQHTTGWGWGYPESWGSWSDGEKAAMIFPLPSNGKAKQLQISARALITPNHPKQGVEIKVDGIAQKPIVLTKADGNLITIDLLDLSKDGAIANQYVTIEMDFPDRARPKDLGIGNDDRQLAIGITSAVFK